MSKQMTITIDDGSSMAYVRFAKGKVKRTLDLTEDLNLDLDSKNNVLGLEFLTLDAALPEQRLIEEFHLDAELVERLGKAMAN